MALPILSVARMRAWESASWAAGAVEQEVIARVGQSLASVLRRRCRQGQRVLLLAGRGHNGDDVRAAQSHLAGLVVDRLDVTDPDAALPGVAAALARRPDWVVDGLFGIGLNRALSPGWCALIEAVNASGLRVLAMDVPSGLDADTGGHWGTAIRADLTLTVGAPKRGLLAAAAADRVGRLEVARDVGLSPAIPPVPGEGPEEAWWSEAADFTGFPGRRGAAAHKGDFGHGVVVAGSVGYHGAAVLAARGALRAHPGLVTVVTSQDTYVPVASQLAAAMVHPWTPGFALPGRTTSLVVGPGLAHPTAAATFGESMRAWWRGFPGPMVVDASALDWIEPGVSGNGIRVVTPHPGEAARLLGCTTADVQSDRPAAVRALSARTGGAWVVLKGQHTLVGCGAGAIWWNGTGNPSMAQGGTGDILAGYLGGLLAQPAGAADPLRAIRAAVWRHGAAADFLDGHGFPWVTEDLVGMLEVNPA